MSGRVHFDNPEQEEAAQEIVATLRTPNEQAAALLLAIKFVELRRDGTLEFCEKCQVPMKTNEDLERMQAIANAAVAIMLKVLGITP